MNGVEEILATLGGIGNAAGIKGDGLSQLNAMQRAALTPEQAAAYAQQQNEQSALSKLNSGNPNVNAVLPYLAPNDALGAMTNPMLMQGNPAPSALSTINNNLDQPPSQSKPSQQGGLDTNYLNTAVPPFYRNQVMDVIQGGELAKDVSPRDRTLIMNWAHNVDPTFTETKGTLRNKMAGDIASNSAQSQGGQAVQINSVMGHLYDLHEAAPDLHNTASPLDNKIANGLVGMIGGSIFHPNALQGISKYNEILTRASPELNKFYVGGEGDKEGRALGTEAFSGDLPADVIKDNTKTQVGMLHSKIQSLQDKRDSIMGSATSPVVTPTTQALMDDINGKPLSPKQQVLVNAHRAEANLPVKSFPKTLEPPSPAMPGTATHPHANTFAGQQTPPQITPEMARAELARRRGK